MLKRLPTAIRKSISGRQDSFNNKSFAKRSSFIGISFETLRNIAKPSHFNNNTHVSSGPSCRQGLYRRFKNAQKVVYTILEDPNSSPIAKLLFLMIIAAILFTTIDSIVSTTTLGDPVPVIQDLELAVSSLFVAEYCLRIFSATAFHENFFVVMIRPFNIIDLISIIPFFIELGYIDSTQNVTVLKTLRIVRLARILRVLKIGRYLKGIEVFLKESKPV